MSPHSPLQCFHLPMLQECGGSGLCQRGLSYVDAELVEESALTLDVPCHGNHRDSG